MGATGRIFFSLLFLGAVGLSASCIGEDPDVGASIQALRAGQVLVCHEAGASDPTLLAIDEQAVPGHLRHGDCVADGCDCDCGGPCTGGCCTARPTGPVDVY